MDIEYIYGLKVAKPHPKTAQKNHAKFSNFLT
jgi:hypothetical protein